MVTATLDPDGRKVVLTEMGQRHIRARHPEVARRIADVMRAVREPDRRARGTGVGEESFFVRWQGPGAYLQVVVHYEHGTGEVKTAFPVSSR